MNWNDILEFARGPFFQVALLVFIGGMAYRLVRVLLLGWKRDRVPSRGSKVGGVGSILPQGRPHLAVHPLGEEHLQPQPDDLPGGRAVPPGPVRRDHPGHGAHAGLEEPARLSAGRRCPCRSWTGWRPAAIVAMIALFINRLVNPVLKLISGPAEWLNWLFVFLPMVTGYIMTHHLFFRYEVLFSLHMLAVDVLLIWIPFSRISHFMFYFFSRTIHGAQFGKRAVTP